MNIFPKNLTKKYPYVSPIHIPYGQMVSLPYIRMINIRNHSYKRGEDTLTYGGRFNFDQVSILIDSIKNI